uniref:Glycosyl transferase family 1 domain-containing protein n=1 Tax=viral metagenome TaxID=1070528 RepID=A0A6C0BBG4_9ZZZZ
MSNFPRIIFIDHTPIIDLNHHDIKNRAIGASEYQFYNLIDTFSKVNISIICFNKIQNDKVIDNVHYKPITTINVESFLPTDKIIIQRYCSLIPLSIKNEIFVWFHDQVCNDVIAFSPSQKINDALEIIHHKKNIHFIFNSYSAKKMYLDFFCNSGFHFEKNRYTVIYNILYEDDFIDSVKGSFTIDKNRIVFGSAWCKGIDTIITLFRWLIKKKPDIKLILLSPGYDYDNYKQLQINLKNEFKDKILILGPLDKKSYCKIIRSSLCVLSTSFFETFGCIFAESYYLQTPVIADIRSGAVKEIIDNNYIIDYLNPPTVLEKINELQEKRNKLVIRLNNKFLLHENLLLWKKLLFFQ